MFDSTDEEMDEEIAARFETLHQERKQRMEEAARQTGAFKVHENTIEIQFPKRAPEAAQKPAQAEKPAEKAAGSKQPAAKKAAEPEKGGTGAKRNREGRAGKTGFGAKDADAAHLGWLPGGGRDV